MIQPRPEVLSPAGSMDSLVAAVRSGADAVYLGAKEFSARRNADNFGGRELSEAVNYCRLRGVKVYLTLNTIVRQKEFEDALQVAKNAYSAGINGVIVQDLGLARAISAAMPGLELHASTQMSVHSPAALKVLKELGFCRVVAAREMSEEQLAIFCAEAKRLGLEVEVFVHGALCMSVSGQCLLSAVLGARSGNRGLCAGPCRLPFAAQGGTGYDLSLKDLSLFNHISRLAEMGVASLKIEGRMKRPEYVAAATAACRSAVDNGCVPADLEGCLHSVFSRSGFTDGYFTGGLGRAMFGIRTKDDVLESKDSFSSLHELYRTERQSVEIKMEGSFRKGEPSRLDIICKAIRVSVQGEAPQAAQNRATAKEDIIAALGKLGSTPYFCRDFSLAVDDDIFIRNSALNALRRDAVEELNARRSAAAQVEILPFAAGFAKKAEIKRQIIARVADTALLDAAREADMIAFPCEQDLPDGTDTSALIAELPRWIEDEQFVIGRLRLLKEAGVKKALCGNLAAIALARLVGLEVMGDTGLNIYNDHAAEIARQLGCSSVILSAETTAAEARCSASSIPTGIFAYGRLPLMLLKNCPLKNGRTCAECDRKGYLTDRRGIRFPVRCRRGYSQLLNSTPVYLADRLGELEGIGLLYLYFTDETAEETAATIKAYKSGGPCPSDFTRGLTFRPSL